MVPGGYGDGTFRPDQALTEKQLTIVIGRAFPEDATRADMTTFLRGGAERLAALPSQSGDCGAAALDDPASPDCPAVSGDWTFWVRSVERSSWGIIADQEEGFTPIKVSVTVRYDGTDDVGSTFFVTDFDLFITGVGYEDDALECSSADDDYIEAPELLAGASTNFKVCFSVPEDSAGSGAFLRVYGDSSETFNIERGWHSIVIP